MLTKNEISEMIRLLEECYPEPVCALEYRKDYELLFAVPPARAARLEKDWPFPATRLTAIGSLTGATLRRPDGGYEHFSCL